MTAALFDAWYCAEYSGASSGGGGRGEGRTRSALAVSLAIVRQINDGDVAAFDVLVRTTMGPLVRFAYSFVQMSDVAEDVVQDVFVRVWEGRATWRPSDAVAYLFAAVRNDALKVLRHRAVESRHEANVQRAWVPDATATRLLGPDELVVWEERMRAFESVLNGLTERQRSAFVLRYEQGLTVPAIAAVLGIGTKGAEKLVARVTTVLRERLRDLR